MPNYTAKCSGLVKIKIKILLGCHTRDHDYLNVSYLDHDYLKVSDWNSIFNENTNRCAECHPLPKLPDFESKLLSNFRLFGFKFPVPCYRVFLRSLHELG